MTERHIDPSNYTVLTSGPEDEAWTRFAERFVDAEERKRLIEGIIPALDSLSTEQLEVVSTTVVNMGNINLGGRQNG